MDWLSLYENIEPSNILPLLREPSNEFDSNAIKVMDNQGNKLGYIPQYRNKRLAKSMDNGASAVAVVLDIDTYRRYPQLTVEILQKSEASE